MPFMSNPNLPADELIEVLDGAVPHHERSGWVVCDPPLIEDDELGPVWLPADKSAPAKDAPAPASDDAPPAEPDTTSEPSA
jgi:hypothetical protein